MVGKRLINVPWLDMLAPDGARWGLPDDKYHRQDAMEKTCENGVGKNKADQ